MLSITCRESQDFSVTWNTAQLDRSSLLACLKACSRARDIEKGRQVHAHAINSRVDSDIHVASSLVTMYMKCGTPSEAREVFDRIVRPDVVCWNAFIAGYAENGDGETALQLFQSMRDCCAANSRTLLAAVQACSSLAVAEEGQEIDGKIVKLRALKAGMEIHCEAEKLDNIYLENAFIDMYVKCGSMMKAQQVFDRMKYRDLISWNVLMMGYAQNGESGLALEIFWKIMRSQGGQLDTWSFVAALKACSNLAAKEEDEHDKLRLLVVGVSIHYEAKKRRCDSNIYVENSLIDMYAKCGSLVDARRVFDSMQRRDVISWNALILGYVENGEGKFALQLFADFLRRRCCAPDRLTYVAVLKACSGLATQEQGRQVDRKVVKIKSLETGMALHAMVVEAGFDQELFVGSALVDMYSKCGSMEESRRVFDAMKHRDVVSWNAMISGYAQNENEAKTALDLFEELQQSGGSFAANSLTFVAAFKACGNLATQSNAAHNTKALEIGMALHCEALRRLRGSKWDTYVTSSLVDMYSKCGSMADSSRVFFDRVAHARNVVQWNALILGFAENGEAKRALKLFYRMQREGWRPNASTYASVFKAVTSDSGRDIQAHVLRGGFEKDRVVAGCLVDFYGKTGDMISAQQLFDSFQLAIQDLETWSALIAGYSRKGDAIRALELFHQMLKAGVQPSGITALSVLSAFSHAGFVGKGRKFFDDMQARYGIIPQVEHFHCVIDLLSRANQHDEALSMVQGMKSCWNFDASDITWTTLIGVKSRHGVDALVATLPVQ